MAWKKKDSGTAVLASAEELNMILSNCLLKPHAQASNFGDAHLDLKKLFASSLRQKILKQLSLSREVRVIKLVRGINSTYNEVNRNLRILEVEGIIVNDYQQKVRHGKVRVIRLNRENPRTKILLEALKILENKIE
jgi:hypothetical protein